MIAFLIEHLPLIGLLASMPAGIAGALYALAAWIETY